MDDIPICPLWWPELIWRLIHHPEPPPWWKSVSKDIREATEELLAGLATYHQVQMLGPKAEKVQAEVRRAAVEQMGNALQQLARD
jgi:hypothetical protein